MRSEDPSRVVRNRRVPGRGLEALERRDLPATLMIGLATGSDPDGNGVVLADRVAIVGTAGAGDTLRLEEAGSGRTVARTRVGADGRYALVVALPIGRTSLRMVDASAPLTAPAGLVVTRGDVVIDFNTDVLDAIRADATGPPDAARALAMVQLAESNAVESAMGGHAFYRVAPAAQRGASPVAAAAMAAVTIADALFPDRAASFVAGLAEALATVHGRLALSAGVALGAEAGRAMLALRAGDGSSAPTSYTPGTAPGDWVPTPTRYAPALDPQYASVTPFVLTSPGEFLPPPPPAVDSPEYAAELAQVEAIGGTTSAIRTADQTALARFWSDGQGSSFTPPGHWNQIAQDAALSARMGLLAESRMFATLDAALADAGIAGWNSKYVDNVWRPVTAIRAASLVPALAPLADPTWTPLWPTPPFPSYVSGHSIFSAAAAGVLGSFFGTHHAFTDTGDPTLALPSRHFTSFAEAAREAGISRIFGGIHTMSDNLAGLAMGNEVAHTVVTHVFRTPRA